MDERVTRLAERQQGTVGRRQLLASGLLRDHVDALVRSGRLVRVSRGTYRVRGAPADPVAELWAATLRCGPGALVAGPRLLHLVGVRGVAPDAPFVVLVRPGRTVTGVPWRWHRRTIDDDPDAAGVLGLPSVTPARSLLEAAVDATDAGLAELVDGCRWHGGILERLGGVIDRLSGHPGARRLLRSGLLDRGQGESPPERRLLEALDGLGGRAQVWVTTTMRVDLLFDDAKLVVEYDGRGGHAGPAGRERDGARDAALRALGYAVVHLGDSDVRRPAALRRRIEDLLEALAGADADRPSTSDGTTRPS